ncbi:SCY1 protein kinase [Cryptococcus wingfieldii CBS 7118]|uniref:SCY1 protein kinase n=1 Tax=Cryptococcus wingfieldii CBS 7118 TaxID=1295528 RepID=A0A1E3JWY4_9TREE|nr:SCY1 protein kinase [Cryptococcus wingfieldii CBS 7118]ODO05374.1 SCY1 protein kinase [Cryptococcus wingfieldii CBS 7118]
MNYLKSITSSVLQSTGVTFPFSIGERIAGVDSYSSIWDVREGVKRDDGTPLTLFVFDSTLPPLNGKDRKTLFHLAKNALKKLRTIRHPDIIKYIDSIETETHVYIATERVRPLAAVLRDWDTGGALATGSGASRAKGKEEWIGWGVKSISTAVAFLNTAPLSLHHSYILPSSIFVTPALEWRLSGFELLTNKDDGNGVLWSYGGFAPGDLGERAPPEVKKGGWGALRDTDPAQHDIYYLATLLFSLYNPNSPLPPLSSQPTPTSSGNIPRSLFPLWKRMLNPNARTRLSTAGFVEELEGAGFLESNSLVSVMKGLDNFELLSESEKLSLLRVIKDSSSSLPIPFQTYRVLPSLLHSLSLPSAPSSAMLPLVLSLGKGVPGQEYGKMVLEPVVRLYQSPDRGTRMALLEGLDKYIEKLDKPTVTEKIWPHLITGFADTVPVLREATVKAIYPLSSKLSDRVLNNDLLRLLAKTQADPEPSIRTNTCILLGRLAPSLGYNTKKKVLVPAFSRSLRDTFVHARVAGLMAFMASVDIWEKEDLAGRVLPGVCFCLVDKEKLVRDQAFKAVDMFMAKITSIAESMPKSSNPDGHAAYPPVTSLSSNSTLPTSSANTVSTASSAAGALAGWALTGLSKGLSKGEEHAEIQSGGGGGMPGGFGLGAPQGSGSGGFGSTGTSQAPSAVASQTASPRGSDEIFRPPQSTISIGGMKMKPKAKPTKPSASSSKPGLKLGGVTKKPQAKQKSLADQLAEEYEDDDDDGMNAWGNDDLMDVNADQDDWSAFESAPVPEVVVPPPQDYYVKPTPKAKPAPKSTPAPAAKPEPIPVPSPVPPPAPLLAPAVSASPTPPSPPTTLAPKPIKPTPSPIAAQTPILTSSPALSQVSAMAKSPAPSFSSELSAGTATGGGGLAGMSKEEKEKEMARRREERKAKIAAMKKAKA